jgi:tripartite-type tricarboxylate transporter receptor subunit TctC
MFFLVSFSTIAQNYPSKPIKIVVPFPVGGIADLYSRLIGNRWTEVWGQPVVVENRTGAGGNIAADMVAKSAPDGYTLVMGSLGTHAVNVSLFSKLPFDPLRDFAPVALALEAEGLLAVHPSLPVQSVAELIALATIGAARSVAAPELPTVAETLPGFEVNNWVGLFAPAGTPPEIVGRLNGEVQKFMQSKEIAARLTAEGARFIPMTPDQFGAFVKSEIAKWAPVVKASGAKAD